MKVVMFSMEWTPEVSGGVGTHVYELASGLAKHGVEVTVFAYTPTESRTIREDNLCVHLIPPSPGSFIEASKGSLVRGVLAFNRDLETVAGPMLRTLKADLIHFHQWHTQTVARRLAAEYRIPVVGSCHHLSHPTERWWGQTPDPEILQEESRLFDGRVELITVSHSMKQLIERYHGVLAETLHVVHCALDVQTFLSADVGSTQLDRLKATVAPEGEPVVLYVGRIHPQKGIDAIFQAAHTVLSKEPSTKYLLVGGTDSRESTDMIRRLRTEHSAIASSVKVVGKVARPQLPFLHRLAHVALVPSVYEPFGYTAIEAMASGLPLVASESGGLSEIVVPEETGVLVPLTETRDSDQRGVSIEDFAEAQIRLLKDTSLAKSMGAAGRRRVIEVFTSANMVQQTKEVYQKLQSRGPSTVARPAPPPKPAHNTDWIVRPTRRDDPALRLICFHSAGMAASMYAPWCREAPGAVEVSCIQLPGREDRWQEPPLEVFEDIVEGAFPHAAEIATSGAYALFGHSMGALVALELAALLADRGYPSPAGLFVASSAAPHAVRYDEENLNLDERIRSEVKRRGLAQDEQILDEFVRMLKKTVEADLRAFESYKHKPTKPLATPIIAYRGTRDYVTHDDIEQWSQYTLKAFRMRSYDGDHFFLQERSAELLDDVLEEILRGRAVRVA